MSVPETPKVGIVLKGRAARVQQSADIGKMRRRRQIEFRRCGLVHERLREKHFLSPGSLHQTIGNIGCRDLCDVSRIGEMPLGRIETIVLNQR